MLAPHLGVETPVQLRRRCRRTLARISPDLLRQRAKRAREECGLRRWVDEPGVDRWEGTFPSEQAAEGWAAVDALARRYVAEGLCQRVEQARARALMDLIRQQATIDVQLVVTVPAGVCTGEAVGAAAQTSAASGPSGSGVRPSADIGAQPATSATSTAMSCAAASAAVVAPARSIDSVGSVQTALGDDAACGDLGGDLIEVAGPFPGDPVLVGRQWVDGFVRDRASTSRVTARRTASPGRPRVSVWSRMAECDVVTGALLDVGSPSRDHLPTRREAQGSRQDARRALPLPGVLGRRPVLRPRPRTAVALRPDGGRQPHVPLPTPPPRQTASRLARSPASRRSSGLDRPDGSGPHLVAARPARPRGPPGAVRDVGAPTPRDPRVRVAPAAGRACTAGSTPRRARRAQPTRMHGPPGRGGPAARGPAAGDVHVHEGRPIRGCRVRYVDDRAGHTGRAGPRSSARRRGVRTDADPPPF